MKLRTIKFVSKKETLARIRALPLYTHPSAFMWQKSMSIVNQFCDAVVSAGYLTYEQMFSAACRYCIGASKLGGVIFWQIDHEGRVHDGKIMYYQPDCHRCKDRKPTWVSYLLRKRREASMPRTMNREPLTANQTSHCFFGLHLLMEEGSSVKNVNDNGNLNRLPVTGYRSKRATINFPTASQLYTLNSTLSTAIAIVEAEKSAFILSELYPEYIWLATGGLSEVQPEKFRPLQGHKVVMFPDTDPDGIAFKLWTKAAREVMQSVFWEGSPPIRVSPILELNATAEQKQRKIDLVDYYFEQLQQST